MRPEGGAAASHEDPKQQGGECGLLWTDGGTYLLATWTSGSLLVSAGPQVRGCPRVGTACEGEGWSPALGGSAPFSSPAAHGPWVGVGGAPGAPGLRGAWGSAFQESRPLASGSGRSLVPPPAVTLISLQSVPPRSSMWLRAAWQVGRWHGARNSHACSEVTAS